MPLMPKRVKYRKEMRRVRPRKATKGNYVAYGDFGLQAMEGCWLKGTCIEAGRHRTCPAGSLIAVRSGPREVRRAQLSQSLPRRRS